MPAMFHGARQAQGSTLGRALLIYSGCLLIFVFLIRIEFLVRDDFRLSWLVIASACVYFALGFTLSRAVLRHIITWHPLWNTVSNVASTKFNLFVLWPILYPVLFLELLVMKIL